MNGVNKAIIVGTLGKNPELKYTASGQAVVNFSVATNESFKDRSGAKQTKTTWHNIVIWGKLAEIANQYLTKGASVYLEGKIENRSYDDKDGNRRYVSEIVIGMDGKMIMLGGKKGNATTTPEDDPMSGFVPQNNGTFPEDDPSLPF